MNNNNKTRVLIISSGAAIFIDENEKINKAESIRIN